MKANIKRIIKIVLCVLLVGGTVLFTQGRFDHNALRLQGFYLEDKNSIDVVMMGASEVYTGFAPGQAYKEYGFTSYPYAVEENTVDLYKYEINEILNYQTPKLLVIEVNGALYDNTNVLADDANIRRITDYMPCSENKKEIVDKFGDPPHKLSYYLPFIKYHGGLSSFKGCFDSLQLKLNGKGFLKGITTETVAIEANVLELGNDIQKKNLDPIAEEKFREFLKYCNENVSVNILFVRFPHAITTEKMYERYKMGNKIGDIINEYGYQYINFETNVSNIGFDFSKDFLNDDHMNVYGQEKFTRYFSEILCKDFGIKKSNLNHQQTENWNKSADYTMKYYEYAKNMIDSGQDLWLYESVDLTIKLND